MTRILPLVLAACALLGGCAGAYVAGDVGADHPRPRYASAATLASSTKSSGLGATVAFQ